MKSKVIFLLNLIHYDFALNIYKSQLPLEVEDGISGLQYSNENQKHIILSKSLTCCIRFKLMRLSEGYYLRIT